MLSEKIEQYISEKVENFKNELKKEVEEMVTNEANKTKTIWDLKKEDSEKYYCIDSDGAIVQHMFDESFDEVNRDMGNAFLTREEAEFELERRRVEAIMRKYSRPFRDKEENWHLLYNYDIIINTGVVCGVRYKTNAGIPYFETKEIAQKVIDEIGKERLEKYWFGVKE